MEFCKFERNALQKVMCKLRLMRTANCRNM